MNGKRSKSPHWNRREVLQTGLKGGAAAMAAAYGLRPDFALAQVPNEFDGSKFQLAAPEANPKRGGVLRYGITSRPPHFDVHQSGTINSLGMPGLHVRQSRPPRSARQRQDHHPRSRPQLADFQGRQDLHVPPAQGRAVPRRRRVHRRRREGHLRPHLQAADRHLHPALDPVQLGERDQRPRQAHDRVQAVRAAPGQLHHVGLRQRLERHLPQEDAGGQSATTCAALSTFPAPARSRASAGSRTKSG